MSSPTCLSCNKPFPANGELASLPEGRRIAFDPGQRRVWRICTKCGEWNLLGAEAAGVSLTELEARQPALAEGVHTSHLSGRMELVRVNNLDAAEVAQFARAERHRALAKTAADRPRAVAEGLATALVSIVPLYLLLDGRLAATMGMVLEMVALTGYGALWRALDRWWQRLPALPGLWLWAVAAPSALFAYARWGPGYDRATAMWSGLVVTLLIYLIVRRDRFKLEATLHGPREWDQVRIRWIAHPFRIQLRPLRDTWLSTEASEGMLRAILSVRLGMKVTPAMVEEAVQFIAHSGPLGLLGVLEGLMEREGGELTLGAVPPTYLIALDIALAGAGEASDAAFREHERLREATAIAQIAESLDEDKP